MAELIQKVPAGTRIWITADHGMINVQEKVVLGRDNSLLIDIATIAGEPALVSATNLAMSTGRESETPRQSSSRRTADEISPGTKSRTLYTE